MRTTLNLPDELLNEARRKAAADGRTVTSLVVEGLHRVLEDRPAATSERRLPRTSSATGGMLPGWDPAKLNTELEESRDIERHRR